MIVYVINWLIWSFIQSLLFTCLFIFIIYWFYFKKIPQTSAPNNPQFEPFNLDETLIAMIDKNKNGLNGESNSAIALNMLFQFLFQELKDTKSMRRYIIRKISIEFEELLKTKTAGKFIERLSARDFSLGTSFPIIHSLKLISYEMDSTNKLIDEMSILLDLEYKNGFSISVDADLLFGKSAYTHIKIALIKGKARLQFSRQPFTHWSFAFVEEPVVEIDGSSQFEGRQMPKLTYLIINQLRRSIRRKHTLPNYKIRFKPFFETLYNQKLYKSQLSENLKNKKNVKNDDEKTKSKFDSSQYNKLCDKLGLDLSSVGVLQVNLKTCDRLPEALYSLNISQVQNSKPTEPNLIQKSISSQQLLTNSVQVNDKDQCFIYLTTSIDEYSMGELMDKRITRENWPFIEFEIQKTSLNQFIGINFMEIFFINKTEICIQKILPNTPASKVKSIKQFDILYSINQVPCSSIKTLNKLITKFGLQTLKFVVQRPSVLSNKPLIKLSSFPMTLNPTIDEDSHNSTESKDADNLVNQQKIQIDNFSQNVSASSLVDFYCNVQECAYTEQLNTLDLMALLTDSDSENDQDSRFQKTRDIKLEKENLFSLQKNRLPIPIDDIYKFNLSRRTKYLNTFLWTVQYSQKSSKKKNLLIGYISVPLNELAVDCWSTSKGETQTVYFFRPIEELKASAISKIAKSHVISDHLGFDSNIALGNLTINFQHSLDESSDIDEPNLAIQIAKDLVDNNLLECELVKQENNRNNNLDLNVPDNDLNNDNDDCSLHKFVNVQFNRMVLCETCNKKIWFKNAYQCAYCNCIIHIKCYDKAINKSICPRFYTKYPNLDPQNNCKEYKEAESGNDDSFVILNEPDIVSTKRRSKSPSEMSIASSISEAVSVSNARAKVSSFINGLRQRNISSKSEETDSKTKSTSNLLGYIRKKKETKNIESETKSDKNSDESNNMDDFKDIDPSGDDKLFGMELFDDLDDNERRLKYEEQIVKYQNTVDMMTKLKIDLENELDICIKQKLDKKQAKKNQILEQQEHSYKSQIKHLNEQIKCVLFLLMQCKLGLDNLTQKDQELTEKQSKETEVSIPSFIASNTDLSSSSVESQN
ncbi:unnamed protein product [Brachionus calyciflorus]|uniref:PDZ domain-containing 8 n=1 Tax=Brachionus calyciflorus TaxID=104777 RepID=A0A813SDK3_9BILA|nr:unnamed protein product [Brachionus calyciflorus]